MVYIDLNKGFLDNNRASAQKEAENTYGNYTESKTQLIFSDLIKEDEYEITEITQDGEVSINFTNELGYFSFDFNLDYDQLVELIAVLVKKLNKMKAVVEGLK